MYASQPSKRGGFLRRSASTSTRPRIGVLTFGCVRRLRLLSDGLDVEGHILWKALLLFDGERALVSRTASVDGEVLVGSEAGDDHSDYASLTLTVDHRRDAGRDLAIMRNHLEQIGCPAAEAVGVVVVGDGERVVRALGVLTRPAEAATRRS